MENLIKKTKSLWEGYWVYFFYLFAVSSALSISASTVLLSIFFLFYILDIKENIKYFPKDFKLFLFFYLWRMITLFLNGFFLSAFSRFFNGIWDKSGYFFCSNLRVDKEKIFKFIKILVWLNFIIVLYALLQKYAGFPLPFKNLFTPDMIRFKGFHSHPLRFAGYFSIICVVTFSFASFYYKRFFYLFPVIFFGLMLNGSRTYWFSVILTISIISFLKNKKFFIISALSTLFFLIVFFNFFKDYRERIDSAVNTEQITVVNPERISISPEQKLSHLSLRKNFWKAGIEIFSKSPIYGVGDGRASVYLKDYMDRGLIDNNAHCHNIYITYLAEDGIIGLALLLWILFYFIKKYYLEFKNSKDDFEKAFSVSLLAIFLNILFSGLTEHNFATFVLWGFSSFYMGIFESYKRMDLTLKGNHQSL